MIEKVSLQSVENRKYTPKQSKGKNPSFSGLGDGVIQAVQLCEKYPMVNVSALDLSTAIIPRTVVETKEANGYAGFEAFRRESSGLIVNCLIPSFIVLGLAKTIKNPIMGGFNKSDLSNTWANSDSLDKIQKYYLEAKGEGRDKVRNMFKNMFMDLEGVDGDVDNGGLKKFSQLYHGSKEDFDKSLNKLTDSVMAEKLDKKAMKKAISDIISKTHIAENIKFKDDNKYFSSAFDSLFENASRVTKGILKEDIKSSEDLTKYVSKAKKLVKYKSLAGLGVIIPLAISMQPINRWITSKTSGKKGAPIYKDYKDSEHHELSDKQKASLLKQKFISIGSMIGVSLLSMMKMPSMRMLEFKGLFPSMDQARIISTATFASRMASSEDKNELREATIRDIATFSSLYFLGDYAAKAIASTIEKHHSDVHLINRLKNPKRGANSFEKLWNWVKNTSLKSSDELATVKEKRLRTICQLGNLGFSLLALGIFIPELYKAQTNKKHQEDLAKARAEAKLKASCNGRTSSCGSANDAAASMKMETSSIEFEKNLIKGGKTPFKAFFNS
ncbi:MAG: hypothetical protein LKG27_05785 [Clostridiaceae bacterium]|jgi:hypothetical protein|nr:hypothetical protein [Clostridiaceae bacterium]